MTITAERLRDGEQTSDEFVEAVAARKRALLAHFGSAKAVSRAGLSDLTTVDGISETVARQIYNHFHEKAAD